MAGEHLEGKTHHEFIDGRMMEFLIRIRGDVAELVVTQRERMPKEGVLIDDSSALMPVDFKIKGEFEWEGRTVVVLQCKNGFAKLVNIGLGLLDLEAVSAEELKAIMKSNPTALKEMEDVRSVVATAPNDDKKITIMDTDPNFPDYNVSIGERQVINPNVAVIAFRKI